MQKVTWTATDGAMGFCRQLGVAGNTQSSDGQVNADDGGGARETPFSVDADPQEAASIKDWCGGTTSGSLRWARP